MVWAPVKEQGEAGEHVVPLPVGDAYRFVAAFADALKPKRMNTEKRNKNNDFFNGAVVVNVSGRSTHPEGLKRGEGHVT